MVTSHDRSCACQSVESVGTSFNKREMDELTINEGSHGP